MTMKRGEALEVLEFNSSDNPSEQEIKKAYRKLTLIYHSNKHLNKSEDEKSRVEENFKELCEAYELLTNQSAEKATILCDEDLEQINSREDVLNFLRFAILNKQTDFLEKLLSKFKNSESEEFGDYINDNNLYNHPVLIFAVTKGGNIEIIKLLLKHGANYNIQDKYGCTALRMACAKYNEIVELLLECGADPNIQDNNGYTVLLIHIIIGMHISTDGKITELLLKHGADPNIKNNNNDTTLYWACCRRNSKVVELLLKYGADPSHNCSSALYWAFYSGYDEIIELLLQYHEDPNVMLGSACESGDVGVVKLLLKYGADPNKKIGDKDSPIELISSMWSRNNGKVKNLLVQYGGVDIRYIRNQTVFACCCLVIGFATLYNMSSPWCYVSTVAVALTGLLFTYNALYAFVKPTFFPTKPSSEFVEVESERVMGLEGDLSSSSNILGVV